MVASLVAVFLAGMVTENVPDLLEENHSALLEFTENNPRPEKTQNKTQWGFIGSVATGKLNRPGVAGGSFS